MNRAYSKLGFCVALALCFVGCERDAVELPEETLDAAVVDGAATVDDSGTSLADLGFHIDAGRDMALSDERCDGIDNDGDGLVDDDDSSLEAAPCLTLGACSASGVVTSVCLGASGWQCIYSRPATDRITNVQLNPEEADADTSNDCDGIDNDCDGRTDEAHPSKGNECSVGVGECRRRGTLVCAAGGTGLECSATVGTPSVETCNGLDDDCDGDIDEGAENDAWLEVGAGPGVFRVFAYEATRPDATATSAGALTHRACGASGRMPWTNVTYDEAVAACEALDVEGSHLCTEDEWATACRGPSGICAYSYAGLACDEYSLDVCNDAAHDVDPGMAERQSGVLPSGTMTSCAASWDDGRVYDLAGNVAEWTAARGDGNISIRGGSNTTPSGIGTTCDHDFFVTRDRAFFFGNIGFRCCAPAVP